MFKWSIIYYFNSHWVSGHNVLFNINTGQTHDFLNHVCGLINEETVSYMKLVLACILACKAHNNLLQSSRRIKIIILLVFHWLTDAMSDFFPATLGNKKRNWSQLSLMRSLEQSNFSFTKWVYWMTVVLKEVKNSLLKPRSPEADFSAKHY